MRHIATLVLAALLVVGTLPAVGAAWAQHGTDAQYTTNLGGLEVTAGELQAGGTLADDDGTATNHTGATVTGYEIADRTLAGDEPLRLRIDGTGEGETPIVLTVDGERAELGTLTADGERVSFEPAETSDVEITCEFGYDSDDGWYLRCEITFSTASLAGGGDGWHTVAVNDLPATELRLRGDYGSVDEFAVVDRTVNPDEPLRLHVEGARGSAGSVPLVLSVDGERTRLGTVGVTEDGATFVENDDLDAQAVDVSIHCEGGYNSEDGWWFECEIDVSFASISDGSHDVSVNDLEGTAVEVDPGEAYVADFGFANATLRSGDVRRGHGDYRDWQRMNLMVVGDSGSTPVDLTVDGERYRIGTVRVEDGNATFVADEDAESASVIFPPWPRPGGPCPFVPPCFPLPLDLSAGTHDVGIAGVGSTQVAVGEELEVTGYEFAGAVESANDTDAAVTVFRNNTARDDTATLAIRGSGVGETPLSLSVDGERTRLGTVSVDAGGANFVPDDDLDAQPIDVDVDCEAGYDSEDGWYVECRIEIDLFSVSDGDDGSYDVGVNDLEPTRVDVQPYEAQLASYDIRNNTVRTGGTVQMTTTFEGKTGEVPVVLTVDGQEYRAATVTIEDGRVASVETADASASPIGFVPCPDLQDDDPLVVVWCASDVPSVAQGTHDVGVNGMEPTEVTVESRNPGPFGPVDDLGDVLDLLLDGLFGG